MYIKNKIHTKRRTNPTLGVALSLFVWRARVPTFLQTAVMPIPGQRNFPSIISCSIFISQAKASRLRVIYGLAWKSTALYKNKLLRAYAQHMRSWHWKSPYLKHQMLLIMEGKFAISKGDRGAFCYCSSWLVTGLLVLLTTCSNHLAGSVSFLRTPLPQALWTHASGRKLT